MAIHPILGLILMNPFILCDFSENNIDRQWNIVNDGVMGGRSRGQFIVREDHIALFKGDVSLENNGGFTSVRYTFDKKDIQDYSEIYIKVKGDGKKYQFRTKSRISDFYSYRAEFVTSGEWQEIIIPFNELRPIFRGRLLDMPGFDGGTLQEISFLISNKKAESFELLIDRIELR